MVSSASYESTQFNLAAQGRRQPGSTFKTFVLTTAIKQGIDPYSTYYTSKPLNLDLPYWGHWEVATADEGYQGTVNLQQATVAPTTPSSPSSTSTSGRRASRARRSRWGSRPSSTGSRPRGSAACGSASRRWRWPTPTRPSPPAASTSNPVAIERVVFPDGHVERARASRDPRAGSPRRVAYEVTPAARQHHRRHRHRRLHRLRRPGGQDRHDRRIQRRLVHRLHAEPGHRGLGRLPGVLGSRCLGARDHRLRRHLPGRDLALDLLSNT